jgi:hypothetical protein
MATVLSIFCIDSQNCSNRHTLLQYKTHTLYEQYTSIIQPDVAKQLKNSEVQEAVITTMKDDYSNRLHHVTHKLSKMLRPVMYIHGLRKDLWVN